MYQERIYGTTIYISQTQVRVVAVGVWGRSVHVACVEA